MGSVLLLVFLLLACSPTKAPTPTPEQPTVAPVSSPEPTFTSPTSTSIPPTEPAKPTSTPVLPTATPRPYGGQLVLSGSEPVTLDPALSGDAGSHEYIGKVFSGLVRMGSDLEVQPDIAERWEVDNGGTAYTFFLRQNVTFHDGRPVTAQDIAYAIERACDPATGSNVAGSYLGDIVGALDKLDGRAERVSGVQVLDDHRLRLRIDAPKPYFLAKLTYPTAFVVDREQVEGAPSDWWMEPNGTGPFKLTAYGTDAIVLTANEDFYRGRPALDEVTYRLSGGGAVGQYERGEVDVAPVSSADIDRMLDPNNPLHDELVVVPSLDTFYVAFNVTMPPFDDEKVRLAFAHATNKGALADIVLNKMVEPAAGILPPGLPGYDADLEAVPFDLDRALALLDESKYAGDLPPVTYVVSGQGGPSALEEALAESYRQSLGMEIEIQATDWPQFLEGLNERRFQMYLLGWVADYPDPENFLDLLFHSQSAYNHMAYSDPEVDALLERARVEPDQGVRLALYRRVEEMLLWDAAWIPLYHGVDYQLVKPHVGGLTISPQGFYFLEDAFVRSD
jgi:ABC-type transport system substrate-binding protein